MSNEGSEAAARLTPPVSREDHVQGRFDASVTMLEYADFECPYCRAAVPIVQELQRVLRDQLRFVFRHLPLTRVHPHAQRAAEAAEAAGAQRKFFEMHDLLFAHQDALDGKDLVGYAAQIGLDIDRFRQELDSHAHAARVEEDVRAALESGARGTPTFYLDDLRYDGVVGVRQMLDAIRRTHPDAVSEELEESVTRRLIPRVVEQRSRL